jgi:plasmid maintenance system antidote protein VapI
MSDIAKQFATWRKQHPLNVYLEERGLSKTDLAALFGVTRVSITTWVNGGQIREEYLNRIRQMIPGYDEKVETWQKSSPRLK